LPVRLFRTFEIRLPKTGQVVHADKPVFRIGSHPSCDLVLPDQTVSKQHLEVQATAQGYRLLDLASSNGTFMGGVRIADVTVTSAVDLLLGDTPVRFSPLDEEVEVDASSKPSFGTLVGKSAAMRELFRTLETVATSDVSLLLEGETGVGKEEVAESVHMASSRKDGPFVVVDCAALQGELLESELFGHVRGAFSGAHEARQGLMAAANGGTLLLDEIGELPLPLQAKLLGALERRKVTPIGSTKTVDIDVRVIAATHRDLARQVNLKLFRSDLFFRLAVIRIRVPALRDRIDDIPLLCNHFLAQFRERYGDQVPSELSAVAVAKLTDQAWPGNVRELRNAVERAVLKLGSGSSATAEAHVRPFVEARDEARDEFERKYFVDLIDRGFAFGQLAQASQLDRRYLQRILRRLGLYPLPEKARTK
jgi:DNA-binding NtrC family response regulator